MRCFSLAALLLAAAGSLLAGAKDPRELPGRTDLSGDLLPPGAVARLGTLRFRHYPDVQNIAFSPDAKAVATGGHRWVYVREAATGKELWRLEANDNFLPLAFSPDGKLLAVGGKGGVRLCDAATGAVLRECRGVRYSITALSFSPRGRTLAATAAHDKDVRLWDVQTTRELNRLPFGVSNTSSLAFAPDGRMLACGGDGAVRFWEPSSGKELFPFPKGAVWGESVAFSPDGKLLATAGSMPSASQCSIGLWEVATGRKLPQFGEDDRFGYAVAFAPDGKTLGVVGSDGILGLWEVATGKFLRRLGGLPPGVSRGAWRLPLAFSPDGKTVAARPFHGNVLSFWDTATGAQASGPVGHDGPVEEVVASPDGRMIASRSQLDTAVRLWDAATGKHAHTLRGHAARVATMAFTPDGRTLVTSAWAEDFRLWDVASGKQVRRIDAAEEVAYASLAVSPDGKTLAAGTSHGMIVTWDYSSGRRLFRWLAHPPPIDPEGELDPDEYLPVTSLRFSPDGNVLVSGSRWLTLYAWSVASGRRLRVFQADGARVGGGSLAFLPDGKTLIALGRGGKSFVWELASGKRRHEFRTPSIHGGPSGWSAISTDARTLAICGYPSDTIQVWDLLRGEQLGQLKTHVVDGHLGGVTGLAFLGRGRRIISASDDTTMLLWEAIAPPKHESPPPRSLSAERLSALWLDLAHDDAARAGRAMATLTTSPGQTVALLRDELRPVAAPRRERLAQLIAQLDDDRFAVRAQATGELAKLGSLAEPELRKVQASPPSPDARVRVEYLLDRLIVPDFTLQELRMWRALEVLEQIGRLERFRQPAESVLQRIAEGAPGHFFTQEAKSALARLGSVDRDPEGGDTP